MSTTFVDDGIVLRRVDYAEADRVLTVLTRDHGKIGVMARGVRRARARMAGHTDLFSRSRMQLARGRGELWTLTQADHSPSVPMRAEPVRLACAAVIAELADRLLESDAPDTAVYDLVAAALDGVFDGDRDPRAAVVWSARIFIDRLGYAPVVDACPGCVTPLREEPAWFSASGGGLLCADCAVHDPAAVRCTVRVIKVLRVIAAHDGPTYGRLRLDDDVLGVLEDVIERELAYHFERRLKSVDVLRALRAAR